MVVIKFFSLPDQKLVLYSQRINVDMHNAECLGRLHGQLQIYKSQDTGTSQDVQHMLAEKVSNM